MFLCPSLGAEEIGTKQIQKGSLCISGHRLSGAWMHRNSLACSADYTFSTAFGSLLLQRFRAIAQLDTQQQMVWELHQKLSGRKGNPVEDQDLYSDIVMDSHQLFDHFHAEHSSRSDDPDRNSDWSEHTYSDLADSSLDVDGLRNLSARPIGLVILKFEACPPRAALFGISQKILWVFSTELSCTLVTSQTISLEDSGDYSRKYSFGGVERMGLDRNLSYYGGFSDDEYLILGTLRGCNDRERSR